MQKLKELRLAKGLSQQELAEKIGVLQKDISRWETGFYVPRIETIKKIAEKLEVDVADLI